MCLNIKICKCLVSNKTNRSNFLPHKVVGRGSETQLQVGENSNYLIECFKVLRYHTTIRCQIMVL